LFGHAGDFAEDGVGGIACADEEEACEAGGGDGARFFVEESCEEARAAEEEDGEEPVEEEDGFGEGGGGGVAEEGEHDPCVICGENKAQSDLRGGEEGDKFTQGDMSPGA
jgi:hypothetical protein